MTRRRFYGDIQDIHHCGYGTRPVQAPSPLLPKDLAGDISLDLGTPLESYSYPKIIFALQTFQDNFMVVIFDGLAS